MQTRGRVSSRTTPTRTRPCRPWRRAHARGGQGGCHGDPRRCAARRRAGHCASAYCDSGRGSSALLRAEPDGACPARARVRRPRASLDPFGPDPPRRGRPRRRWATGCVPAVSPEPSCAVGGAAAGSLRAGPTAGGGAEGARRGCQAADLTFGDRRSLILFGRLFAARGGRAARWSQPCP